MWGRLIRGSYYVVISLLLLTVSVAVIGLELIDQVPPVEAVQSQDSFWLSYEETETLNDGILFSQHDSLNSGNIVHVLLLNDGSELFGNLKVLQQNQDIVCQLPLRDLPAGFRIDFMKTLGDAVIVNLEVPARSTFSLDEENFNNRLSIPQSLALHIDAECNLLEMIPSIKSSSTFSKHTVDRSAYKICYASSIQIQCLSKGQQLKSQIYTLEHISQIADITIGDAGNIIFAGDLGSQNLPLILNGESYKTKGRYILGNINASMNQIDWFYSDEHNNISSIDYDYGVLTMMGSSLSSSMMGFSLSDMQTSSKGDRSLVAAFDVDKRKFTWAKEFEKHEGDLMSDASKGLLYITHNPNITNSANASSTNLVGLNIVDGVFEFKHTFSAKDIRYIGFDQSNHLMVSGQIYDQFTDAVSLFWGTHSDQTYPKHIRCYEDNDKECGITYI